MKNIVMTAILLGPVVILSGALPDASKEAAEKEEPALLKALPVVPKEERFAQQAEEILRSMTPEEKVAQMFFVTPEALSGEENVKQTDAAVKGGLEKYPVGGIVYFAANLETPEQTGTMLFEAQAYAMEKQGLPLFLGVDEEGGRVRRIGNNKAFPVEQVGDMGTLAGTGDRNKVYEAGNTIGAYLKELGFNVDFAPDADVLTNADNQVIGSRSFGREPELVADMALAFTQGLQANHILGAYKHFPGHGGTVEDSHTGYAYSYKTLEELYAAELIPFQDGVKEDVPFIMVSHISVPEVTGSDVPASLSEVLVTDILREEMGYQGIIITDSLLMGAVSDNYDAGQAAKMAVLAGCDMLLMPQDFQASYDAILKGVENGTIPQERIDASVRRIVQTKLEWMAEMKEEEV